VIELDAASHNKVEDIREIRINVGTVAAAAGARRVYILDEAHMLTRAASNALLKTLEEPPEHVVFVLATTEPYKLLDTIRSRTQRFDFHPIASGTLIDHLATIADKEGFTYDHDALRAITGHAGGSVRDALSLLEQVAALGSGAITSQGVSRALGVAQTDSYGRLLDLIAAGDAAGGLMLIAELASQGADLRRFVADAIAYLRGVFLAQYTSNIDEVVDASTETIEEWRKRAETASSAEVLRAIDEFSTALLQLRDGREERLVVELAILRLTRPETVPDLEGMAVRIDRLERRLREIEKGDHSVSQLPDAKVTNEESLAPDRPFSNVSETPIPKEVQQGTAATEPPTQIQEADTEPPIVADAEEPGPVSGESPFDLTDFERVWPAIVAQIRQDLGPRRHALLKEASPAAVTGETVMFEVAAHMHFHLEHLKADEGITDAIVAAAMDQLGRQVAVAFRSADAEPADETIEPERAPDKDDLVEAEEADQSSAVSNVLDVLGGEIVSG